jgi:hypothetical protein
MARSTPEEVMQQLIDGIGGKFESAVKPLIEHQEHSMHSQQSSAKASSSSDKKNNNKQAGLLKSIVQNISLPLPGGARLFGLSSFMDKIGKVSEQYDAGVAAQKSYNKLLTDPKEQKKVQDTWDDLGTVGQKYNKQLEPSKVLESRKEKAEAAMSKGTMQTRTFTAGITAAGTAVVLMTEGLRALGKSLGGVSEGQAAAQLFGAVGQTFRSAIKGEWLNPKAVLELQGSVGQEFGQLLTSEAAGRMAKVATDFAIWFPVIPKSVATLAILPAASDVSN